MLEHFYFLNDHEVVIVRGHAKHHAVLHIQRDLARITILSAVNKFWVNSKILDLVNERCYMHMMRAHGGSWVIVTGMQ